MHIKQLQMKTMKIIPALFVLYGFLCNNTHGADTAHLLIQETDTTVTELVYSDTTDKQKYHGGQMILVEEMPAFPGGEIKFLTYLAINTPYPPLARENNIKGTVVVRFMIDKEGNVVNAYLPEKKKVGGGCDQTALNVIKKSPQWIPGKHQGVPVAVWHVTRINFGIKNKDISIMNNEKPLK